MPWQWSSALKSIDLTAVDDLAALLQIDSNPTIWFGIADNRTIRHRHLLANPDLPWPLCVRARFADFTLPDAASPEDLACASRACPDSVIRSHVDRLDFGALSSNRNLPIDILLRYPDVNWSWAVITERALRSHHRSALQREHVFTHLNELPWDMEKLCAYEGRTCNIHGSGLSFADALDDVAV
jgi:hypothetical protein